MVMLLRQQRKFAINKGQIVLPAAVSCNSSTIPIAPMSMSRRRLTQFERKSRCRDKHHHNCTPHPNAVNTKSDVTSNSVTTFIDTSHPDSECATPNAFSWPTTQPYKKGDPRIIRLPTGSSNSNHRPTDKPKKCLKLIAQIKSHTI